MDDFKWYIWAEKWISQEYKKATQEQVHHQVHIKEVLEHNQNARTSQGFTHSDPESWAKIGQLSSMVH